jgi:ubiquinone/menaquinone biosynthesis C-methylase UbiE
MRMHSSTRLRFVTAFVLATLTAGSSLRAQSAANNAADAERLIKALEIHAGSFVGEIGAGDGTLSLAIARAVGDTGRVYSNELNKDRLKRIGEAADKAKVSNVMLVEGREAETNFAEACCDAIFMRNVYHHFGDPAAMNASLLKSLKPGGRLAVLDFTPPPGKDTAAPGKRGEDGQHGVTSPVVERELKAAGFEIVSSESSNRTVFVVARRPSGASQ